MAPLDTGTLTPHLRLVDVSGLPSGPAPEHYDTLGAFLRAVREHRGLTLAELAASTRIRRQYLTALEERDRSALPSRPFAIGYVRAYAKALGLDGEYAVQRFKLDWPESDEPLRNPVGVRGEGARSPVLTVAIGVLLAGVAVWNIAQRMMTAEEPTSPALSAALLEPVQPAGASVMTVATPSEAPVASTVPAPYVTPGLFPTAATPDGKPAPAVSPAAAMAPPAAMFSTRSPVLGAPSGPVVLQARRSVALIVRAPDRSIVFARQLAPGEAFRAPLGRALTADVSDPASVAIYSYGALKGVMSAMQTPLDALTPVLVAPAAVAPATPGPAAPAL